jgi:hypothetical protein
VATIQPAGIDWQIGLTVGANLRIAGVLLAFLLGVLEIVGVLALLIAVAPVSGTILGWFSAQT